jgi:hypothetical protein
MSFHSRCLDYIGTAHSCSAVPFKLVCFRGVVVYAISARNNFVQMIWLGQVASLFLKGNCGSMLTYFIVRRNSQERKQECPQRLSVSFD